LLTDKELATQQWKKGYEDDWPVERAYPNKIKNNLKLFFKW